MNCINCYQEIPDESRFCPHCGAEQPDTPKTETAAPADSPVQTETNQTAYQDSQTYGSGYQENHTSDYQNNQYQTPPVYQSSYEPENQINWVPYLVLSIISTAVCRLVLLRSFMRRRSTVRLQPETQQVQRKQPERLRYGLSLRLLRASLLQYFIF